MRYLTDDLLPVFLGAGRGSLSLAREIYRTYGAKSVILAEENVPRHSLPFARLLPVSPRLWQEALWDLVKREPVGRAALLLCLDSIPHRSPLVKCFFKNFLFHFFFFFLNERKKLQ